MESQSLGNFKTRGEITRLDTTLKKWFVRNNHASAGHRRMI